MSRAEVKLKKGEGRTIKSGGLWIYDNEIADIPECVENGDIVDVLDFDGYYLGSGYINRRSKITIRLLTRRTRDFDIDELIIKRVKDAWEYRKKVVDTSCCRLIFAEADFLPGIVIDKFGNYLVSETLTLGMEQLKMKILGALTHILLEDGVYINGIFERNDAKVRELEGLPRDKGFLAVPFDPMVRITENGVKYIVDIADGQKTGFFLDQKYNRLAVQKLCKGAKVLDCFTHTGSFALNAAYGGASSVLAADISELAINQARENAELNGFEDRIEFVCTDVFDLLPKLIEQQESYDVVILDPPAFTKSRSSIKDAVRGYKEINLRGMKLVKNGGYLCTCSCSHFMDPDTFYQTLLQAAHDAHKRIRQVEFRTQAPDHPILWAADESYYLKFYILQVCDEV